MGCNKILYVNTSYNEVYCATYLAIFALNPIQNFANTMNSLTWLLTPFKRRNQTTIFGSDETTAVLILAVRFSR